MIQEFLRTVPLFRELDDDELAQVLMVAVVKRHVQGNVIVGAAARTRQFTLPAGNYRFEVSAINAVGEGNPVLSEMIAAR